MMFFKLWKRYIIYEFLKVVLFFLTCFYLLYVFVDLSTHVTDFIHGKHLSLWKVLKYYVLQFIKRCDILLPLSLLIGTIKVLCQFNTHKELVALQSAGISKNKILRPLLLISGCFCLLNLIINEFVLPYSLQFIDKFYDAHIGHRFRGNKAMPLRVIHLDDHSKLVYQYYDSAKEAYFDVVWIRSGDDIWRMKYLKADPENPLGEYVDHLRRNETGGFQKEESYVNTIMTDISWSKDLPQRGNIPFENRSIRALWTLFKTEESMTALEKQSILTQLLFKLSIPFLSFLSLIAVAPFCIKSSRHFPQFFIYGLAIFGFVAVVAFLNAAVIVGESDTLSPFIAIFFPFTALFGAFGWRFLKI